VPRELFAVERLHLKPLPAWMPEVYRLHRRTADIGRLCLGEFHSLLGSGGLDRTERRRSRDARTRSRFNSTARHIVVHDRVLTPPNQRIMRAGTGRRAGVKHSESHPEEKALIEAAPEIAPYISELKQKGRKAITLALRQMLRLLREYPREPFLAAVAEAGRYGLYDLDRLERMILRRVARDYFLIGEKEPEGND
jgi:hypothetical protein